VTANYSRKALRRRVEGYITAHFLVTEKKINFLPNYLLTERSFRLRSTLGLKNTEGTPNQNKLNATNIKCSQKTTISLRYLKQKERKLKSKFLML
jgi:hypothetical protein